MKRNKQISLSSLSQEHKQTHKSNSHDQAASKVCEVCFHHIPQQISDWTTNIITCISCQRSAHVYCYAPYLAHTINKHTKKGEHGQNVQHKQMANFQCDVCAYLSQKKQLQIVPNQDECKNKKTKKITKKKNPKGKKNIIEQQNIDPKFCCSICNNGGLLKKVINSDSLNPNAWGHPICLILSQKSLVHNYEKLQFVLYRNLAPKKPNKKSKQKSLSTCSICKNEDQNILHSSALCKCFNKDCQQKAHLYCIIRNIYENDMIEIEGINEDDEEKEMINDEKNYLKKEGYLYLNGQRRWNQNLQIFPSNHHFDFLNYFQKKFKNFLKNYSPIAFKHFYKNAKSNKKEINQEPLTIVVCDEHETQFMNCNCLTADPTQVNWVGCDGCGKWYHFHCEGISSMNDLGDVYICTCCKKWRKAIEKQRKSQLMFQKIAATQEQFYDIKYFPKMHFYDFVFIQNNCERRRYRMNSELQEMITKLPFLCSLRYLIEIKKEKQVNPNILKSISLGALKKKIQKIEIQQLDETIETPKPVMELLLKIDLLMNEDFITSIQNFIKGSYSFHHILQILDKMQKKYRKQSHISQPIIKRLKMIQNSKEIQQIDARQNEKQQIQDQLCAKASKDIAELVKILKQSMATKNRQLIQKNLGKCIQTIHKNQSMRNGAKILIDRKLDTYGFLKAFFTFKNVQEIHQQINLKCVYRKYIQSRSIIYGTSVHQQQFAKRYFHYYMNSTLRVRLNNEQQMKEIYSLFHKRDRFGGQNYYGGQILQKKSYIPYGIDSEEVEVEYLQTLKFQRIREMIKNMEIKQINKQKISDQILKIKPYGSTYYEKTLQSANTLLLFYEAAYKLLSDLGQIKVQMVNNKNIDLVQKISSISIDKYNYLHFVQFINKSTMLKLQILHDSVYDVMFDKGTQILNFFCGKNFIFSCEEQLRMVQKLMTCLNIRNKKMQDLIEEQKNINFGQQKQFKYDLQDPCQIQDNLKILKCLKQFSIKNSLTFRIPKIDYVISLISTFEESFRYFPPDFLVKEGTQIPNKYDNWAEKDRTVDFYLLKKFIYKLKMIRFPQNAYMFRRLNQIYMEAFEFHEEIYGFIRAYNLGLEIKYLKHSNEIKRYNKVELKQKIFNNKINEKVCFQPQILQIQSIFDIHNQLLRNARQMLKKKGRANLQNAKIILRKLYLLPFEIDEPVIMKLREKIKSKQEQGSSRNDGIQKSGIEWMENQMPTKDFARILVENLIQNPRTLSLQEVKAQLTRINTQGSLLSPDVQKIDLMIENCIKMQHKYARILAKFVKKQPYCVQQLEEVKNMVKQYEMQNIRVQIIQNISTQHRMYDRLGRHPELGPEQRQFISKSLAKSFSSISNNSQASHRSDRQHRESGHRIMVKEKVKKQKQVYRTFAEQMLGK